MNLPAYMTDEQSVGYTYKFDCHTCQTNEDGYFTHQTRELMQAHKGHDAELCMDAMMVRTVKPEYRFMYECTGCSDCEGENK
jgi:hypothetical protein